ncbi:peroxisomal membrane protein PEX14 isoform X2 [Dendroctonus ponderosae]|uniref:Peroxisomal membrane protein PEX14 n=1 Tax=Dendroctonus ponderosae TaxID=77166 RepID=A0AAR5QIX7_DENPD|nr:peroxisomal membrane protein PEX14 isoform X2 [Dendroctonus ponderosae]
MEDESTPVVSVREDLVAKAVKFLENPKVIQSPLVQKQRFLQNRGLTEEEIRVACERSGAYDHHERVLTPSPPGPHPPNMISSYRNYGPLQTSWFSRLRDIVHSIAIFSVVVYAIKKFYDMYVSPFLFGKKRKSIEDKLDDLEQNVGGSMRDLQSSIVDVKTEVDRIYFTSEKELLSELKDLKSEVGTLKGLLLTRKQFPSVSAPVVPPSIPAWQMSSVHPENEAECDNEDSKEEMLEVGSGSGCSEPEHGMKTSESSLEIINHEDVV